MKVLLVEDDRKIATGVQRGLKAEGFAVEVATDGDRGPLAGHGRLLRPDRARHHAAGPKRVPGVRRRSASGRSGRRS